MSFYITYNDVTNESFGIKVVRRPAIPAPEPVYEPYTIPGRDGVLMPAEVTYAPIEIDVELNFMSSAPDSWGNTYRQLKKWLSGSGQLSFSDDSGWFYKVYSASVIESERTSRRIITCTAHFVCDPYNYATSGQSSQSGTNLTLQNDYAKSHPIYTMTGSGTLTVNGNTFGVPRAAVIDTDKLLVTDRENGDIINSETTGNIENLFLNSGSNSITSTVTVQVVPNWRSL